MSPLLGEWMARKGRSTPVGAVPFVGPPGGAAIPAAAARRGRGVRAWAGGAAAAGLALVGWAAFWRLPATAWALTATTAPAARADFAWMFAAMQIAARHIAYRASAADLYNVAAQRLWLASRGIPYTALELYSYPPPFAAAFAWLGFLGYGAAGVVWSALSLVAFVLAIACLVDLAAPGTSTTRGAPHRLLRRPVLLAIGLSCFPALTTLYWGQSDNIILALIAFGLWLIYRRRRPALGGASIAVAAAFKLTPAVILVFFAVRWLSALARTVARPAAAARADARPDGRVLLGGAAGAGVLTACSVLALGWKPFAAYLHTTLPAVQQIALAVGPAPMEQSLRGVLLLFLRQGALARAFSDLLMVAAAAAVILLAMRHPRADRRVEAAAVALLPLICAPSLEGHHFVVAAAAEVLLGGWLLDGPPGGWLWVPYAAGVLLLTLPGVPFLPAVGRPVCSLPGQPGLLPGGGALGLACDAQHLWALLLLFGVALAALPASARQAGARAGRPVARRRVARRSARSRAGSGARAIVGPGRREPRAGPRRAPSGDGRVVGVAGAGSRGSARTGGISAADRRVYEKILFAHYLMEDSWDGEKHRQTLDRCLSWLLGPGDTGTAAYLHFEFLRGRDGDFIPFLRERLGYPSDEAARERLRQRLLERAAPHLAAARARGGY